MKSKILVILILVTMLLSTTMVIASKQVSFNKCHHNKDWFITTTTLCPCNSGGNQVAVNSKGLKYWNWWHTQQDTSDLMCMMVYNCWSSQAKCVNKVCVLG